MVGIIKKTFPGIFTIARATNVPGVGRLIDKALFEGDDMIYLPRDSVIEVNREVEAPADVVLPSQVVDHFIEEANYLWIMDYCICREGNHCEDYPHELGCLFMGEAAMQINPGLGRKVTKDEAKEHAKKCREAGLVHLIGRNKLDEVWLWVSPGHKLLTVCNCCPCCCIWRTAPYLTPDIGRKITRMPGVTVQVTGECEGCGTCVEQCFVQAISLEEGRAVISESCRGCGQCVSVCPDSAIEISIELEQSIKDSIERIAPLVDVT
jgi:ferredoxin